MRQKIYTMSVHVFKTTQLIPTSLEQAWEFFSSPKNLAFITPAQLKFRIISTLTSEKVFTGQLIAYNVSPLWNIRVKWISEIKEVRAPVYFIDEQRKGPYKMWRHQHFLTEVVGGIEMADEIHYKIGYEPFGDLINNAIVRKRIERIFRYRRKKIEQIFATR